MDSRTQRDCQPDSPTGSSRRHFMRLLGAGAAAPFLSSCGSDERRSPPSDFTNSIQASVYPTGHLGRM